MDAFEILIWILAQGVWLYRITTEWIDSWEKIPMGYTPMEAALVRKIEWENMWNWYYLFLVFGWLTLCGAMLVLWVCVCVRRAIRRRSKRK
jgi:hypothetical protein